MARSWIKVDSITEGSPIDLNLTNLEWSFAVQNSNNPIAGKQPTGTVSGLTHELDWVGIENPSITVDGYINSEAEQFKEGSILEMSIPLLASVCTVGSVAWFFDPDLEAAYPGGSFATLAVQPSATKRITQLGSGENAVWRYSLQLMQTEEF